MTEIERHADALDERDRIAEWLRTGAKIETDVPIASAVNIWLDAAADWMDELELLPRDTIAGVRKLAKQVLIHNAIIDTQKKICRSMDKDFGILLYHYRQLCWAAIDGSEHWSPAKQGGHPSTRSS